MKQNWRIAAAVLTAVLLVAVTVFVLWASDAAAASDTALQAMNSDSQVYVSPENGWVIFSPAENPRPQTGFIFYPGGKVDYRAYAPVLKLIAEQGYFVAVVPVPLNLAMLDVNAAARVQAAYPEIQNWFVGGHSLGGVAAAAFSVGRQDINGLVLWASGPADDSLRFQGMPVLLIHAANDGLFTQNMADDALTLLPEDAEYVVIEGGNHAQFGSYGPQAGDNNAGISPEERWSHTANATVDFFKKVSK